MRIYSQDNTNFKAKLNFQLGNKVKNKNFAPKKLEIISNSFEKQTKTFLPEGDFYIFESSIMNGYPFEASDNIDKKLYHHGDFIGVFSKDGIDELFKLPTKDIVRKLYKIVKEDMKVFNVQQKGLPVQQQLNEMQAKLNKSIGHNSFKVDAAETLR